MTQDIILANAQLILPGEVVRGSLVILDGEIAAIDTGKAVPVGAVDCRGDYVSPGLIELHTDNLERHITPRPGVDWPHRAAIIAHDRQLSGTGITTVFDAIRVGSIVSDTRKRYGKYARQMANEILAMRAAGALKISHHLHLRAEICSETLAEELDEFGDDDRVGIVSLMDHTPGQRQFRDVQKFEDYVCTKHGMSRDGFSDYIDYLCGLQDKLGAKHEAASVAAADQVAASHGHGVTIAEFPTTLEAAQACRDTGMATIMGAPNLVRGGSHSGNVAAYDLAKQGLLDILLSDYVPSALLLGAVQLGEIWGDMAKGLATVTTTPAQFVGLTDRGALRLGLRGDVIRFAITEGTPGFQAGWSAGIRVA